MATAHTPAPTLSAVPTVQATTIVGLFRERARTRPDAVALRHHDGRGWKTITRRGASSQVTGSGC